MCKITQFWYVELQQWSFTEWLITGCLFLTQFMHFPTCLTSARWAHSRWHNLALKHPLIAWKVFTDTTHVSQCPWPFCLALSNQQFQEQTQNMSTHSHCHSLTVLSFHSLELLSYCLVWLRVWVMQSSLVASGTVFGGTLVCVFLALLTLCPPTIENFQQRTNFTSLVLILMSW